MAQNVGQNEQMVRYGAGAALMISGLWNHNVIRMALGGALLWTASFLILLAMRGCCAKPS